MKTPTEHVQRFSFKRTISIFLNKMARSITKFQTKTNRKLYPWVRKQNICAWIFVFEHCLFWEVNSFPRAEHNEWLLASRNRYCPRTNIRAYLVFVALIIFLQEAACFGRTLNVTIWQDKNPLFHEWLYSIASFLGTYLGDQTARSCFVGTNNFNCNLFCLI